MHQYTLTIAFTSEAETIPIRNGAQQTEEPMRMGEKATRNLGNHILQSRENTRMGGERQYVTEHCVLVRRPQNYGSSGCG